MADDYDPLARDGFTKASLLERAEIVLASALPELFAGTHAILPVEATEEMVDAGHQKCRRPPDQSMNSAMEAWRAMVSAYLSPQTVTEKAGETFTRADGPGW